jgi:hypothetical protein
VRGKGQGRKNTVCAGSSLLGIGFAENIALDDDSSIKPARRLRAAPALVLSSSFLDEGGFSA